MANGRWIFTGDPIRFSKTGTLLDGQHRLHALAEIEDPDFAIEALVITGLDQDTQMCMDQGARRTAGQQLGILGYRNANLMGSVAKQMIVWENGLLFKDTNLQANTATFGAIEDWLSQNEWVEEWVAQKRALLADIDATPTVILVASIIFARIDMSASDAFISGLALGGYPVNHPITTLDRRLQRDRRKEVKNSFRSDLGIFIAAWNAWRDGREISKLQRPLGGEYKASNFPIPH